MNESGLALAAGALAGGAFLAKTAANLLTFPIRFIPKGAQGPPAEGQVAVPVSVGASRCEVRLLAFGDLARAADPDVLVVVYSHGNAETLSAPFARHMREVARRMGEGVVLLAYDYPGYGLSTGTPSERSATAALRAVLAATGVPNERAVLCGRSVGSGPTMAVASEAAAAGRPFRGVCLIAPFTSVMRVRLPFSLPGIDLFDNLRCARRLAAAAAAPPITEVLIVHGGRDQVVPVTHGRELAAAMPGDWARLVVEEAAGHNDADQDGDQMVAFVRRLRG